MKIRDILESLDGPKQGSTIIKTMDRETFDLLKDLNQWKKEKESNKLDIENSKTRDRNKKKRAKNSLIWVANWPVDVQTLEEWLETKDDNIPLTYSITHGWGLPRKSNPTYQLMVDDPEYKIIILDIWKSAAHRYRYNKAPKDINLLQGALMDRLSILGRKYRLALHVDKSGRRLGPNVKHPEFGLPHTYTHSSELNPKKINR